MRNAFAKEMEILAADDPDLVLLTGDMGNRLFNSYKQRYPNRFYNCGVAESNMASVAAGMALCGLKPVTYSIAPFNTLRCMEQIKIDICYHKLPVIVVGVGAGLSYGELGPTHQSCEDISMMRSIPGMTVVCPGDAVEVRLALRSAVELGQPVYLRLGKKNEPIVHQQTPELTIGKALTVTEGKDICLICTGNVLPLGMDLVIDLKEKGLSVGLVSMHTVKPLDDTCLREIFSHYSVVATIEEHSIIGGLGTALQEWLYENKLEIRGKLMKFGIQDQFLNLSCNQLRARKRNHLTVSEIRGRLLLDSDQ
ncbi:transketolase family protein [Desulfobacter latus]|uniref:Transketolase n=1 Tax=Desulfobacter latus TaxID=2292 RepID=A0A850T7D1_9BACT|nr:transketolase C-terminal domain-containing protein [Desulfobacter latus]NWH04955.1 transketolase [Desulfobacter latus]